MPLIRTALIAAAAALVSATAYAQTTSADTSTAPQAPATDTTAAPQTTTTAPVAMAQNEPATGVTVTQTQGGVDVISAQPVPDTAANRAKYGAPMSRAGRRTAPAGN